MAKAGTNAGLGKWCTRLAIKPGIQARSLTIVHLPGHAQGYPIGVRIHQLVRTLYRVGRLESWLWKSNLGRIDSQTLVQASGSASSIIQPLHWEIVAAQFVDCVSAVADLLVEV